MRKGRYHYKGGIAQCALMLGLLALFSGCGDPGIEPEQKMTESRKSAVLNCPQPEAEGVLSGERVLDLGNHMVAYYESREEIDSAYTMHGAEEFEGERYIAIHDLDYDAVWYLPDVYGRVLEISVEEPVGLSLRYAPDGGEDIHRVRIPIYFYERDEGEPLDFDGAVHGRKSIFGAQEGLEDRPDGCVWNIWEEAFSAGETEYTIRFERISPIYNPGYIYCAKDMYIWLDGMWRKARRLERVYSGTDFYDIPGEDEYPYLDGYRELVYSQGEVAQENRIEKDFYEEDAFWFAEECVRSADYRGSVRLYPDYPEWEKAETITGGIVINKYVRVVSETE